MKILAVVESPHQGNTMKIVQAMAEVTKMDITSVEEAPKYNFSYYDIVGFGSGIYAGSHDKKLVEFVNNFCDDEAYTFVFSTSGSGNEKYNKKLIKLLEKKNKTVLGSFACKGLDKFFFLKLFGGTNKGRPNAQDFNDAQDFIKDVMNKYQEASKSDEICEAEEVQ